MTMNMKPWLLGLIISLGIPAARVAADSKPALPTLSAAQIVEKHLAARGGLSAWRAVQAMSWAGKMDAGVGDSAARSAMWVKQSWGHASAAQRAAMAKAKSESQGGQKPATQVQLPFVLEMKRPHKSRLEIEFAGKTAVQVYDGTNGWKLRPFLNRSDVEPFTPEETQAQAGQADLDGPLVDFAAKGTRVEFEQVEAVEGHDAYRLKLTMKDGNVRHVWIDGKSFLDVKIDGTPRRMDGRTHAVSIMQRDFRSVHGLMIPFVLETSVEGYPDSHKMILEKVGLNPTLDDARFAKPHA